MLKCSGRQGRISRLPLIGGWISRTCWLKEKKPLMDGKILPREGPSDKEKTVGSRG